MAPVFFEEQYGQNLVADLAMQRSNTAVLTSSPRRLTGKGRERIQGGCRVAAVAMTLAGDQTGTVMEVQTAACYPSSRRAPANVATLTKKNENSDSNEILRGYISS